MLPPLKIFEGTVLDFRLYFRVLHGEFLQKSEGTDNTNTQRTTDVVALGPNGKIKGGMRCFSLETSRVL